MPIYELLCTDCGTISEHLVMNKSEPLSCPACGSGNLKKLLSVTSSTSGVKQNARVPGPGDTACCGSAPGEQGCIPGSCCGKAMG